MAPLSKNINVVEFLRVSTQEQGGDDRAGLPRQKAANASTVAKHGLSIVKTIQIVDVSGTSVLHAPEVQEMISLMRSGQVQGVVAADWDRIIRLDNFNDFALLQHFKETKTLIFLPDQVIDLNTQSGFLIGGFQSIISGNELTQIKKRMIEAKEAKRRAGEHPNCDITLPTGVGYDRKARRWFYTPDAGRVKELFELFAGGEQNYRELQRLTGIHHRTIYNLLRNELYIGYRTYTQKRGPEKAIRPGGRQGDRKKVRRAPDEIIRVKVIEPPLVDESLFWSVQEAIKRKNTEYHKKRSKAGARFLYSGFLRCGYCGQPVYSKTRGSKGKSSAEYYICRSKNDHYVRTKGGSSCPGGYMQKDLVEETVTSFLAQRLVNKDYLESLVFAALADDLTREAEAKAAALKAELSKIEKKKAKILDLYGDGLFAKEELDKKVSALNELAAGLRLRLLGVEESLIARGKTVFRDAIGLIAGTLAEYPYWTADQKRTFLKSQIPEIRITDKGVSGFTLTAGQKIPLEIQVDPPYQKRAFLSRKRRSPSWSN